MSDTPACPFPIADPARCCGCGACVARCPTGAIAMQEDAAGFLYPQPTNSRCTGCGACLKVCPFVATLPANARTSTPSAQAIRHDDAATRRTSTSGGLFTALADAALAQGFAVAGAAFEADFSIVRHRIADTREAAETFRGTKYLQSETTAVFRDILAALRAGKKIFFTGTPCQVAAIRLLTHDHPDLITADLVCQAVPSPGFFRRYRDWLIRRNRNSTPVAFAFRDKTAEGWHRPAMRVEFSSGHVYSKFYEEDPFTIAFARGLSIRPACHACPFRCFPRPGDLTLADFWGIEKFRPDLDDNTGTSLALCHSPAGAMLLAAVTGCTAATVPLEPAMAGNPCLSRSVAKNPPERPAFVQALASEPFDRVIRTFLATPRPFQPKETLRRLIGRLRRMTSHQGTRSV